MRKTFLVLPGPLGEERAAYRSFECEAGSDKSSLEAHQLLEGSWPGRKACAFGGFLGAPHSGGRPNCIWEAEVLPPRGFQAPNTG